MPRHICIIRPDIWADDSFNELSCQAKLLWLGLAGFLDCQGRAVYDPNRIAAEIFPGQDLPFQDLFEELQIMDLIALYQVDGVTYLQMANFARHQRRDKRRVSKLPDRDGHVAERTNANKDEKQAPPAGGEPPRASGSSDGAGGHAPGPAVAHVSPPPSGNTSWQGAMDKRVKPTHMMVGKAGPVSSLGSGAGRAP